jgi:hypothetical protein
MITLKLKIKSINSFNNIDISNINNSNYITNKQLNYSYAFRKLYNNINKIDEIFYYKQIKLKFYLNDIELRSLISEVKSKYSQIKTNKHKLSEEILDLETNIKYLKSLPKSNKNTRKLFKLNNLLIKKNKLLSKDIVFGSKVLLKKLSYLNNDKINNIVQINKTKQEYINNRLLPLFILGEANQFGNRFFRFNLINNEIIYKPNKNIKINIEFSNYKSYNKTLIKLQENINTKSIAVSVRLSNDYIYLIFDDELLNGYALNINERTKEVKNINNEHITKEIKTKLIKEVYKKYYKEQENKKLKDKLNYRYFAFDTNPDYIGCCILDKTDNDNIKVVHTFNYDLTELNNLKLNKSSVDKESIHINNKRKHGISHIWKEIFNIIKYYKCGHIVLEDLNLKNKDLGNKTANRKVNNIWYREISNNLINKYCNKFGLISININPCYSSFIGNLLNSYTDSVNASIEICRRGIYKYKKNNFYPKIKIGTIMDTMSRLNKPRDVSYIKDYNNWIEMYRKVRESGLRYRATIDDIQCGYKVVNNIIHSRIRKICYLNENNISLLKIV